MRNAKIMPSLSRLNRDRNSKVGRGRCSMTVPSSVRSRQAAPVWQPHSRVTTNTLRRAR